jgi:gamma-glutamyltranspeptidase/glutathione hydrolase
MSPHHLSGSSPTSFKTGMQSVMIRRFIALCLCFVAASFAAAAQDLGPQPEAATGYAARPLATARRHMIAAADPLAAEAGREMLRQGGSAVDAAIAAQLVLGLVEPQSSGLGGGAFLIVYDAQDQIVKSYDGRETAPASATPGRFLSSNAPLDFDTAVRSGLSIGVPGTVRVLAMAHARHGRLAWDRLFEPAIRAAEQGFPVSQRLSHLLTLNGPASFAPAARSYFFDAGGKAVAPGSRLVNPEYAATLKILASRGAGAFYGGEIARAIVAAVDAAPLGGGMTMNDLERYRAIERPALCSTYRDRRICGMGPPSSGGIAVAQTLLLIEPFADVRGASAAMTAQALHLIGEAEKLAFADRNRYLADPDFVPVPGGLLNGAYLDQRRSLIDRQKAMAAPEPGLPPGLSKRSFGIDATRERAGTSHVSVIDDQGNAVAMTTTIEGEFGSHQWAAGFLLNNELTDFSFLPADAEGHAIANRVEGGKRPRSSMSPTLIFDEAGAVEAATGSPGGSRIIFYVVKSVIALLDWGLNPAASAALPNFGAAGGTFEIDDGPATVTLISELEGYGHTVARRSMTSGIHTVVRRQGRLEGGADPRREGMALGD